MCELQITANENSKLTYKTGDDAFNYADKNKEYITFPSVEKAEWFSSNYKQGTGVLVGTDKKKKR